MWWLFKLWNGGPSRLRDASNGKMAVAETKHAGPTFDLDLEVIIPGPKYQKGDLRASQSDNLLAARSLCGVN